MQKTCPGGQAQRIALQEVCMRQVNFFLDEFTSSLDNQTSNSNKKYF